MTIDITKEKLDRLYSERAECLEMLREDADILHWASSLFRSGQERAAWVETGSPALEKTLTLIKKLEKS